MSERLRPAHRRVLLVAGALAWLVGSALGTPPAHRAAAAPLFEIGRAHAGYTPALDGKKPIFILFLGSDARPGEPVPRSRADSIHILALNPGRHGASLLGFPRDSYVPIPGYGSNKINAAMVYGGPELAVRTVEDLTGIRLDYYVLTSFEGFNQMVDDVGGLVIDVPVPMQDSSAKSNFEPGPQRLDGREALAFTRDRHSLCTGDFGRSENQGRVFVDALAQFQKEFGKDPSRMLAWIGAGMRNVQTDLPLTEVLDLAFTASSVKPQKVRNMVVPGTIGSAGGASIVSISSSAQAIYDDMADDGIVAKKTAPPPAVGQTC